MEALILGAFVLIPAIAAVSHSLGKSKGFAQGWNSAWTARATSEWILTSYERQKTVKGIKSRDKAGTAMHPETGVQ